MPSRTDLLEDALLAETRAREKTCKINALRMQMRFSRSAPEASLLGAVAGRLAIGMSPLRSFRFARLAGKCDRRRWPATEARTLPINSPEADGRPALAIAVIG